MQKLSKEYRDNYKVEIFFRYKKKLVKINNEKKEVERQIECMLGKFMQKTGLSVKSIKIQKEEDKYKLSLEVG